MKDYHQYVHVKYTKCINLNSIVPSSYLKGLNHIKIKKLKKGHNIVLMCVTSRLSSLCKLMSVDQFVTSPWKEDLARSMGIVRCPTPASRVRQTDLMVTCQWNETQCAYTSNIYSVYKVKFNKKDHRFAVQTRPELMNKYWTNALLTYIVQLTIVFMVDWSLEPKCSQIPVMTLPVVSVGPLNLCFHLPPLPGTKI